MFPVLFEIPFLGRPVYTYGALIALGVFVALFISRRQTMLQNKRFYKDIGEFATWGVLGGVIGSQLIYILVEAKTYFLIDPFTQIPGTNISIPSIFAFWKTGFVFWGAPLGGIIALILFCRRRGIPAWQFADLCILGLPIAQAFGRIGCVAAGCCFGRPEYHIDSAGSVIADVPFALRFPPNSFAFDEIYSSASPELAALMDRLGTTVPLFPVQLLESATNIVLFLVLLAMTPFKLVHGQIVLSYLILYSIMRSGIELARGDASRGFVIDNILSTSQFISLVISLLAFGLLLYLLKARDFKQNRQL